jgi:hypothetical protein
MTTAGTRNTNSEGEPMSDTSHLPKRFPVDDELSAMDDPEFLDWCRRVRSAKESIPRGEVPEELEEEFERVNRAFMRRAGSAWKAS